MKKIRAGITGAAGYTGGELLRILVNHPNVEIASVHSKSNAGKQVAAVHQDLFGQTDLSFSESSDPDVDVLFLCLGHGESVKFMDAHPQADNTRIIDLSQDFRLPEKNRSGDRSFVYGLPELNRDKIRQADNIANPGCFATALQLGLLPLAQAGILGAVHSTGITGSTGAGQSLAASSHLSWRANNIQAYKTLSHQHMLETGASLRQLQPDKKAEVYFVPWRGDFTRGIFISSQIDCAEDADSLYQLYEGFYKDHPFTHVSRDGLFLKQVVNTNQCIIHLEKVDNKLVVHSAIDNLLKGASGQAVQNMNIMFGLDETAGLRLKANFF